MRCENKEKNRKVLYDKDDGRDPIKQKPDFFPGILDCEPKAIYGCVCVVRLQPGLIPSDKWKDKDCKQWHDCCIVSSPSLSISISSTSIS